MTLEWGDRERKIDIRKERGRERERESPISKDKGKQRKISVRMKMK